VVAVCWLVHHVPRPLVHVYKTSAPPSFSCFLTSLEITHIMTKELPKPPCPYFLFLKTLGTILCSVRVFCSALSKTIFPHLFQNLAILEDMCFASLFVRFFEKVDEMEEMVCLGALGFRKFWCGFVERSHACEMVAFRSSKKDRTEA
jgi:hypothetical protein